MYDMTLELFGYLTVQACTRMQLKFNESWHGMADRNCTII